MTLACRRFVDRTAGRHAPTPRSACASIECLRHAILDAPPLLGQLANVRYDAEAFDRRLSAPGLHRVEGPVKARPRATILPPALFSRFAGDAFRRDGENPRGVAVV